MINRLALAFLSTRPVAHQLFPPLQWWRFGKRGQRRGSNVTIYHYRRQAVDLFPQFFFAFLWFAARKKSLGGVGKPLHPPVSTSIKMASWTVFHYIKRDEDIRYDAGKNKQKKDKSHLSPTDKQIKFDGTKKKFFFLDRDESTVSSRLGKAKQSSSCRRKSLTNDRQHSSRPAWLGFEMPRHEALMVARSTWLMLTFFRINLLKKKREWGAMDDKLFPLSFDSCSR